MNVFVLHTLWNNKGMAFEAAFSSIELAEAHMHYLSDRRDRYSYLFVVYEVPLDRTNVISETDYDGFGKPLNPRYQGRR